MVLETKVGLRSPNQKEKKLNKTTLSLVIFKREKSKLFHSISFKEKKKSTIELFLQLTDLKGQVFSKSIEWIQKTIFLDVIQVICCQHFNINITTMCSLKLVPL